MTLSKSSNQKVGTRGTNSVECKVLSEGKIQKIGNDRFLTLEAQHSTLPR